MATANQGQYVWSSVGNPNNPEAGYTDQWSPISSVGSTGVSPYQGAAPSFAGASPGTALNFQGNVNESSMGLKGPIFSDASGGYFGASGQPITGLSPEQIQNALLGGQITQEQAGKQSVFSNPWMMAAGLALGGVGAAGYAGAGAGMSEGAAYAAGGDFAGSGAAAQMGALGAGAGAGAGAGVSEGAGYAAGGDFFGSGAAGLGTIGAGAPVSDMSAAFNAGTGGAGGTSAGFWSNLLRNPGSALSSLGGGSGGATGMGGWISPLMSIGSGIYGMTLADQQKKLAQQAIAGSSPWTSSGGAANAGTALTNTINGNFANDPGFALAERAAAATSSTQPGGYAATAAANAALNYQNQRIQALSGPAGVGFNPAQGYATALQGSSNANQLAQSSLVGIGVGANQAMYGNTSMPPWLQNYLIQNGMGSGAGTH